MAEKPKISTSLDEQETTFTWYPPSVDRFADVYSANPVQIRKLKKLCAESPEDFIFEREDSVGAFFRVNQKCFSFHKRKTRVISDEQRAAASARMMELRKRQAQNQI